MKNFLPLEHHVRISANAAPLLRWDGTAPIDAWRETCRQKLWELLGMDSFKPCEPIFEITEEGMMGENRHIHFTLQTEEGYFTHCDLLLPPVQSGPLPLCACLQGHSKGAHISLGIAKYPGDEEIIKGGDRDFAIRAVREGFAALAIEQRGFGLCGGTEYGPACERPAMTAILMGRTLVGERVWDIMRILDAIETHFADVITLEGSVLMGNSGGGTATFYTACLEHRFDGYMPSCAISTYRDSIITQHHCTCNYIPGVAKYFDMGDLAILIAPKKLVVVSGTHDEIFPIQGVHNMFAIMQNLYAASGSADNCALVVGAEGHRFYADDAWPVMHRLLERK